MRGINSEETQRLIRIRKAHRDGPKSTAETRIALIVAERCITEKQLAKYYKQQRKDWKPRFDYFRFADDYDISTNWLFDGDLRSYPRSKDLAAEPPAKPRRRPRASRGEMQERYARFAGKHSRFSAAIDEIPNEYLEKFQAALRILDEKDDAG